MDWHLLLNTHRLRDSESNPFAFDRNPFAIDQDRIVFSQPFRRLQAKTQVHPLVENDHVRTRLTHSIEVGSVGQTLGSMVGEAIIAHHKIPYLPGTKYRPTKDDFGALVQAACLAHDIGNPPFGHGGEEAFREWYESADHESDLLSSITSEAQKKDLLTFEGNAQGFRILSQIENYRWNGGLRLTYATLATFMKYPWPSDLPNPTGKKKFGYFDSEREYVDKVATKVGLIKNRERSWCRHPLVYLMEAADDICYAIVDIEDGLAMGTISKRDYKDMFRGFLADWNRDAEYAQLEDDGQRISYLRCEAITKLVKQAARAFLDAENELMNGTFIKDGIISKTPGARFVAEAKELGRDRIYNHEKKVFAELSGYEVIGGLLTDFTTASLTKEKEKLKARRLLQLMGEMRPKDVWPKYRVLMRVNDFVSGMTDRYALGIYRQLRGISLPGFTPALKSSLGG